MSTKNGSTWTCALKIGCEQIAQHPDFLFPILHLSIIVLHVGSRELYGIYSDRGSGMGKSRQIFWYIVEQHAVLVLKLSNPFLEEHMFGEK